MRSPACDPRNAKHHVHIEGVRFAAVCRRSTGRPCSTTPRSPAPRGAGPTATSSTPGWPSCCRTPRAASLATASPSWPSAATAGPSCAPQSDIDVCCSTPARATSGPSPSGIWYPIWDEGLKLGHSRAHDQGGAGARRRRPRHRHRRCCTIRHLAGDDDAHRRAGRPGARPSGASARSGGSGELRQAGARPATSSAGEVAFLLEPDLKEGRGGLRDVHAIRWAEAAAAVLLRGRRRRRSTHAYDVLLARGSSCTAAPGGRATGCSSRSRTRSPTALGYASRRRPDAPRRRRGPHHRVDERRGLAPRRRRRSSGPLGWRMPPRPATSAPGVVLRDGEVAPHRRRRPGATTRCSSLRAAAAAAAGRRPHRPRVARPAGRRVARRCADPVAARGPRPRSSTCCSPGAPAIDVIEALDQRGPVGAASCPSGRRCAASRSATPTTASPSTGTCARRPPTPPALADRVDRPDLLVVGALLHDIGKGYPGDHTEVGIELRRQHRPAHGLRRRRRRRPQCDGARTTCCCPTSPPAATSTTRPRSSGVAEAGRRPARRCSCSPRSPRPTRIATGPAAWGAWKAELVARPRRPHRPRARRRRRSRRSRRRRSRPREQLGRSMAAGRRVLEGGDDRLTVVAPDRPGLFSRVAGVLAAPRPRRPRRPRVTQRRRHGARGVPGRVAASGRRSPGSASSTTSSRRSTAGSPSRPAWPSGPGPTAAASRAAPIAEPPRSRSTTTRRATATVVEVQAPDRIGVLYRITRALRRARPRHPLAPRSRRSATDVVDAFYVRDVAGAKVTDPTHLVEIERALLHALVPSLGRRSPRMSDADRRPTAQDLLRWSEALAGIARTGLGFTESLYERERFEEVLHVAADIAASPPAATSTADAARRGVDAPGRRRAWPATSRPKVGGRRRRRQRRRARSCSVQRADSGVWLYPTGWADIGYSPAEVAVKEVHEETGIECEVVRLIAVLDGLRLGFTRIPLYSLVFHCRAVGGELEAPPARDARRRLVRARTSCPSRSPASEQWGAPRLRRHPRRAGRRALRPAPRRQPWLGDLDGSDREPYWSRRKRSTSSAIELVADGTPSSVARRAAPRGDCT